MALKGTATIELTNADGSKEIIKHDNMITNAVNDLCFSQRGEMAAILKMVSNNDSYAQAMFGGLLLFGDTLNDNPDDYEIPSTNIIGYASQNAYAGLDLARGSFNQSEGGVQADGSYKFVWDFATSQANGTIKSLALCPNVMGKLGASDSIVDSETSEFYFVSSPTAPFNNDGNMLKSDERTAGISNWNYNIVAIVNDIAYAVDYGNISDNRNEENIFNNGGILKLYRFKLGTDSISLADKVAMARYIDCIYIQVSRNLLNATYNDYYDQLTLSFNQKTKKLYLYPCNTSDAIPVNGTLPYAEIDLLDNCNITYYSWTNTTAAELPWLKRCQSCVNGTHPSYSFFIANDYILVCTDALYIVKRSDNTQIKKVMYQGNPVTGFKINPYFWNDNCIIINSDNKTYIIDFNTGICKRTNAINLVAKANVDIGKKAVWVKTGSYLTYYITINPFILTTKNNLDTPVTKRASQTMKITYTLTESEGA